MSTTGVSGADATAAPVHAIVADASLVDGAEAAGMPHTEVHSGSALENFMTAVRSEIESFRQQENGRLGLATAPAMLSAAIQQKSAAWDPVTNRVEEIFTHFDKLRAAIEAPEIDGLDSAAAREHVRVMTEQVLDADGYLASFSALVGPLSEPARDVVYAIAPRIAAQGAELVDAYNAKAAEWVDGLEREEASAADRRERLGRVPHIRAMKAEVDARAFDTVDFTDLYGPVGDIERQILESLDDANGRIDAAMLRSAFAQIDGLDTSARNKAFLGEVCLACLAEAERVNKGDLSGSLSENILALRLQDASLTPAAKTELKLGAFRESFAAAVDCYNATHQAERLSDQLVRVARSNFSRLVDTETGTIVPDREARCRDLLHPEYDLRLPISGEHVTREQRKFLMEQLDLFVAEPRPISGEDIAALLAGSVEADSTSPIEEVIVETGSEPEEAVVPTIHRDKEVKLPHGVGIVFDIHDDGVSTVRIFDAITGSKAEYALGATKTLAPDVAAALLPLREKLRAASDAGVVNEGLLRETIDSLNDLADGPAVINPQKLVRGDHYFGPGGAKKGGLRVTDQPKPTDAYEILHGARRVTLTAEKINPATGWNSVVVERNLSGVYVTLQSNEHQLPRTAQALPTHNGPAEIRVKIAEASVEPAVLSKKLNALWANMSGAVLERPQHKLGSDVVLGAGELLSRVLAQGEIVSLKRLTLAGVNGLEMRFAPEVDADGLVLVGSKAVLEGRVGADPSVRMKNVFILGRSEIEPKNLVNGDFSGMLTSADSSWNGSLSGSTFSACMFYGSSAQNLELNGIAWLRGAWSGAFNFPPGHAKVTRAG